MSKPMTTNTKSIEDRARDFVCDEDIDTPNDAITAAKIARFAQQEVAAERERIADELDRILLDSSRDRRLAAIEFFTEDLRGNK